MNCNPRLYLKVQDLGCVVGLVSDEGRFTACCYERSWPFRREKASRDVVKSVDGGGKH